LAKLFLKIIPKNISDFFTNSAHLATHLLLFFFFLSKKSNYFCILTNNFLHFYITLTLYQIINYQPVHFSFLLSKSLSNTPIQILYPTAQTNKLQIPSWDVIYNLPFFLYIYIDLPSFFLFSTFFLRFDIRYSRYSRSLSLVSPQLPSVPYDHNARNGKSYIICLFLYSIFLIYIYWLNL
jgi:hypothetical protein